MYKINAHVHVPGIVGLVPLLYVCWVDCSIGGSIERGVGVATSHGNHGEHWVSRETAERMEGDVDDRK